MAGKKDISKKLKKVKNKQEETAIDVLEESVHILKKNALRLLPVYYLGAFPFAIYLLYFINDMSLSNPLRREVVNAALILTMLFAWKNFMQSVFCQRIMNVLNFKEDEALRLNKLLKIFMYQNIIQPIGLFVQIVSVVLFFPMAWTTAFFNSFAALASVHDDNLTSTFKNALKLAMTKQKQNHFMLLIISFFGLMIIFNIGISIFVLPVLLKQFFGIENIFTISQDIILVAKTIFNTTFWSITLICAWLFLDPLLKAAYTVRTFYGESAARGYDIQANLARIVKKRVALCVPFLIFAFFLLPVAGSGAEKQTDTKTAENEKLEKAIDNTLKEREYKWRLPRPEENDMEKESQANFITEAIKSIIENIKELLNEVADFIDNLFPKRETPSSSGGFSEALMGNLFKILVVLCLLIAAGLISAGVIYLMRRRSHSRKIALQSELAPLPPDLTDENLTADELEENAWLTLADELVGDGKLRLALRAVFFAGLSFLANEKLLSIAKFKTNREYLMELKRRSHSNQALIELFNGNLLSFEKIWYGDYEVSREIFDEMKKNYETMTRKSPQ